jgi:predicted membrane protein
MLDTFEHHFILFSLIFLIIGYLLGVNLKYHQYYNNKNEEVNESFFAKNSRNKIDKKEKSPTIDIDDSTFVTKITTDNLEKKYENLANESSTTEDINHSINKLKKLRK